MFARLFFRVQIVNELKCCFSVLYEILGVLKKRVVFENGFFLRFSFGLIVCKLYFCHLINN